MTSDFVLERLEVIGGAASEKESGNETAERMLSFLRAHKNGNEVAISEALQTWLSSGTPFKEWVAEYLIKELK
jgi:hypothetical protein